MSRSDDYQAASQMTDDELASELAYQERAARADRASLAVLRMVRAESGRREADRTAREGLPYVAPQGDRSVRPRGRHRR